MLLDKGANIEAVDKKDGCHWMWELTSAMLI